MIKWKFKTLARGPAKALKRAARSAGYELARKLPLSVGHSSEHSETLTILIGPEGPIKYLPPQAVADFSDPPSILVDTYFRSFSSRVTSSINRSHHFPILGHGDISADAIGRIFEYVSKDRVAQYVSVLDWCKACKLELSGKSVIDVGTGIGVLPYLLKSEFTNSKVSGCDNNEDYIEIAKALFPEIEFHARNLASLNNRYDIVFFTEILEHMADPIAAAQSLVGLLRPGGQLILTVPDGRFDQMESMNLFTDAGSYGGHVNFWSLESWCSFLQTVYRPANITLGCKNNSTLFACIEPKND